ncbi:transmembrane protein 267 [Octodon degus]|uniref:Transmembrane protein 267 n=1 Tax=Octodon degus TaxID=10160 RepID=A0A6P3V8N2_OCTDE|nr:transmembrane protein 267 [Octodon degus]
MGTAHESQRGETDLRPAVLCWVAAMGPDAERACALLPADAVVCGVGLALFCLVADRLLQLPVIQRHDWLRALSDSAVHGVIGMWSWAGVAGVRKKADLAEAILAGCLASVIDVDHFFLARSLSLKAALTLPRRPFLHCSTVIPIVALALKFLVHLLKLRDSWCRLPWMVFVSWTSHHIRDGIRHGLWLCPFGKTSPVPFWLYVIATSSLPSICSFMMALAGTRQRPSSKHGIPMDV